MTAAKGELMFIFTHLVLLLIAFAQPCDYRPQQKLALGSQRVHSPWCPRTQPRAWTVAGAKSGFVEPMITGQRHLLNRLPTKLVSEDGKVHTIPHGRLF